MSIVGTNHLVTKKSQHVPPKISHRICSRRDVRGVGEQVVHLFQRALLRLRLRSPEVKRVGEITHNKQNIKPPTNLLHGNRRHLPNHRVERKRHHDTDTDSLGAGAGVEDLGGHDPGEGAVGGAEADVVEPGHDDEGPGCRGVGVCGWGEDGEHDGGDGEEEAVG